MDDRDARLSELGALSQGLSAAWPTLSKWLNERKDKYLRELVEKDSEQTRGRLKELAELLGLPEQVQQEAVVLQQTQQQESELP